MPEEQQPKVPQSAACAVEEIDLSAIRENQIQPKDKATSEEERKAYLAAIEDGIKEEQLQAIVQDRLERKTYAHRIFRLMKWWVIGVFALVLFQGFLGVTKDYVVWPEKLTFHQVKFTLSDGVLISVVSGTTASVIGIFIVVANYLFPKR